VAYVPAGHGGKARLDLSDVSGRCTVNVYNPRTGATDGSYEATAGGVLTIDLPDKRDWVVHVGGWTLPLPLGEVNGPELLSLESLPNICFT